MAKNFFFDCLRKALFPYKWLQYFDQIDFKGLPPIEAFYNELSGDICSQEEYDFAVDLYAKLNLENFGAYALLYNCLGNDNI